MSRIRGLYLIVGLSLAAAVAPGSGIAGKTPLVSVAQTVRRSSYDFDGIRGSYLASYSTASLRAGSWGFRASLGWLSWTDADGGNPIPNESGPSAAYLTLGRKIWQERGAHFSSSGWLRLRGKVPLQAEPDLTGSGKADCGGSLFTSVGLGRFSALAEIGFLDPGSPAGFEYKSSTNFAISVSYLGRGARIYPLAGYAESTAALSGGTSLGEWSLGLGAVLSQRVSTTALYSIGSTNTSPDHAFALSVWFKM